MLVVLFTLIDFSNLVANFFTVMSFLSSSYSYTLKIMQALVEHYSSKGWLQRVEQCVLHMDISSLDFNQVFLNCSLVQPIRLL
jgi:general stress protein CsbA